MACSMTKAHEYGAEYPKYGALKLRILTPGILMFSFCLGLQRQKPISV